MSLLEGLHYHKTKLDLKSVILLLDLLVRYQCLFITGAFKDLNTFNVTIRKWESLKTTIVILRLEIKSFKPVRYRQVTGLPTEFMKSPLLRMFKNMYEVGL